MGLTGQMIQSAKPTALLDYLPQILGCQTSELSLAWRTQAMGEHHGRVNHHAVDELKEEKKNAVKELLVIWFSSHLSNL